MSGGALGSGGALATGGVTGAGGSGLATGGTPATGSGGAAAAGGTSGFDAGAGSACQPAACGSHKWPCWRMPNAARSGLPNAASYTDLGNGAVLDNLTCLVWEKSPDATPATGDDNLARCAALGSAAFAGYRDWRMPTGTGRATRTAQRPPGPSISTTASPVKTSAPTAPSGTTSPPPTSSACADGRSGVAAGPIARGLARRLPV